MALESYKLLGEIARGGMGVVLRAKAPDGREVAIKILRKPKDLATLQRFERERRLLSVLGEDEGFVPVLEAGESSRGPYIVMPYLAGGSLRERLAEKGPLSIATTVRLGAALAHAVGQAHKKGIVHRDLKPENILFTRAGRPLLADLGLAKHFRKDVPGASRSLHLTGERTITGTVGYMAPEQMRDSAGAGPRCDVFALGAILYECLAGKPAFVADNFVELLTAVQEGRMEPLPRARADCPKAVQKVVLRALSKAPDARYADGSEMAQALEAVPLDKTAHLTPEPQVDQAAVSAAPSPVPSPPPRPLPPERPPGTPETVVQASSQRTDLPRRRPAWLAPVVVAASVAAGAGGVALLFSARGHEALVSQSRERIALLEQQARLGVPQEALEQLYTPLRAQAAREVQGELDLAWARILWRRGRTRAAGELVPSHASDPGAPGTLARRVLADALLALREGKDSRPKDAREADAARADEVLNGLEGGSDAAAADWAKLRRAVARVAEPRGLAEIAGRVAAGTDEASVALLAQVHFQAGRLEEAKVLTAKAVSLAPDLARARLLRARLSRGRLDLARLRSDADREGREDVDQLFRLAGTEAERDPFALFERARSELGSRKYEDALRDLDQALDLGLNSLDGDSARSWFGGSRGHECAARLRALDAKEAIPAPDPASRFDMAATATPEMQKRLAARAARAQAPAREALEKALVSEARREPPEQTLPSLDLAQKLAPRCPVVATERARFFVTRCRPVEAAAQIEAAARLPEGDRDDLEFLRLQLADERGRLGEAHAIAERLAASSRASVWGKLAEVYLGVLKRWKDPSFDVKAWHALAETARSAVALAPENALAHSYLAMVLCNDVGVAAAEVEAQEALGLEGFLQPITYFQALNTAQYGLDSASSPPPPERYSELERAVEDFTAQFPSPYTLYSHASRKLWDDLDAARRDYEKILLLDPLSPWGEEGLGSCALRKNGAAGLAEARLHWVKARATDPSWTLNASDAEWARSVSEDLLEEFGPKDLPETPKKKK